MPTRQFFNFREVLDFLKGLGLDWLPDKPRADEQRGMDIHDLCRALVHVRGEVSALAVANEIRDLYDTLTSDQRLQFFDFLVTEMGADHGKLDAAIADYQANPCVQTASKLASVSEPVRQDLLRALNMIDGGTAFIVRMRADLLEVLGQNDRLDPLDQDMRHLLRSWFNRGFLELRQIGWDTPARILEKLIAYESVHEITDWSDLRRRLAADRMCFGFFHPALKDEPLIFVEVALCNGLAGSVNRLLDEEVVHDLSGADTAIFYSINNCQDGLRGISFGDFLIKQVVVELERLHPQISRYSTLSPIPGFRRWLAAAIATGDPVLPPALCDRLAAIDQPDQHQKDLMQACALYLTAAKKRGLPVDPVERFHLRNGARVEKLNWMADTSANGMGQSWGIMVNYLYDLTAVTRNHTAFTNAGAVDVSPSVTSLAAPPLKPSKDKR